MTQSRRDFLAASIALAISARRASAADPATSSTTV